MKRAAGIGRIRIAKTRENKTAEPRVIASAEKNRPTSPERNARGVRTATVVIVVPTTGPVISCSAWVTASWGVSPDSSRSAIASTTTMASSMTRPMATAIPPRDIRFSVSPDRSIARKVAINAVGTDSAARIPARASRRKKMRTPIVSSTPIAIASRIPRIDSWMSSPWL